MKKRIIAFLSLIFSGTFLANIASAVCPLCVVAVGAGLGLSRWLGIDDAISSFWIGALLASIAAWTIIWFDKKGWNFKFKKTIVFAIYYGLTIWPLYAFNIAGHPLNTIFGMDKIIFGIVLGTLVFFFSVWLNHFIKSKNEGKQHFNYQKVVLPLVVLTIVSLILYFLSY